MRIGYDIDETLFPFMPPLIKFLAGRGIIVPSYERTHSFDLWKVWECTREEAFKLVNLFYDSKEFLELQPDPGALDLLSKLRQSHQQYAITSRPARMAPATLFQVGKHLPQCIMGVHHTGQYTLHSHGNEAATKGTVCHDLGIELFVEDALHHAEEIASHGVRVLLLPRPWNIGKPVAKGVIRIPDLSAVLDYVNGSE
ncbi:MAG TPA: hypothetical protein VJK07_03475 [Candidatus Nanoarchaeia archaeon]|nr:hypothetical protein [Candidatus Nanoarchaeia archaeon]